jgi:hypothetical protein
MMLLGEGAKRLLDIGLAGGPGNAEDFVGVFHACSGERDSLSTAI